jgi:hypothetical protein
MLSTWWVWGNMSMTSALVTDSLPQLAAYNRARVFPDGTTHKRSAQVRAGL